MLLTTRSTYSTIRDRPVKSIIKAVTWRIVGTFDTMALSYFITGKTIVALLIGSLEVFTKMFLYFLHERIWAIVRWGRMLAVITRNTRKTRRTVKRIFLNLWSL
jgi:uncharacterized membrane protein